MKVEAWEAAAAELNSLWRSSILDHYWVCLQRNTEDSAPGCPWTLFPGDAKSQVSHSKN